MAILCEKKELRKIQKWIKEVLSHLPSEFQKHVSNLMRKFLDLPQTEEVIQADDIFMSLKYEHFREYLRRLPSQLELRFLVGGTDQTLLQYVDQEKIIMFQHQHIKWQETQLAEQREELRQREAELNAKLDDAQAELEERLEDMYILNADLRKQLKK